MKLQNQYLSIHLPVERMFFVREMTTQDKNEGSSIVFPETDTHILFPFELRLGILEQYSEFEILWW